MQKFAKTLDNLVGQIDSLQAIATSAQGLKNEDLRKLIQASADPKIQARASFVGAKANVEYFKALVAAAAQELQIIADLTDLDVEFPVEEMEAPAVPAEPSVTSEPPVSAPEVEAAPAAEETVVDVALGDGVEIIYNDDKELFLKLPDTSVLKVTEATARDKALLASKRATDKPFMIGASVVSVAVEGGRVLFQNEKEMYLEHTDKSVLKLVEASPRDKAKITAATKYNL